MVPTPLDRLSLFVWILLGSCGAADALAERAPLPRPTPQDTAKSFKAEPDTTWIFGAPGSLEGTFQDAGMNPDWQGWTSLDRTERTENHWHPRDLDRPFTTNAELFDDVANTIFFGSTAAAIGDVNGDGWIDLAVGGIDQAVGIFYGGEVGDRVVDVTLEEAVDDFGQVVASAGDLDDDGYDDLAIGCGSSGRLYVYWGSSAGISASNFDLVILGPPRIGLRAIRGGFDLSGDGVEDLVVGIVDGGSGNGGVRVIYGGMTSGRDPELDPDVIIADPNQPSEFGSALELVDWTRDGQVDLIVGAPGDDSVLTDNGRIYGFWGGPPLGTTPDEDRTILGHKARLGTSLAAVDVDGDGVVELVVGRPSNAPNDEFTPSGIEIYRHNAAHEFVPTISSNTEWGDRIGSSLAPVGDLDGDGFLDFAAGAPADGAFQDDPYVRVFFGAPAFLLLPFSPRTLDITVGGPNAHFGTSVVGEFDWDGNGCGDLLVGEPFASSLGGDAHLVYGRCPGNAVLCREDTPPASWAGPGYGNDWDDVLELYLPANPTAAVTVRWAAHLTYEVEAGYDSVLVQYEAAQGWQDLRAFTSAGSVFLDETFIAQPPDLVVDPQTGLPSVHLAFRVISESNASDEDGQYPTILGAAVVDDIWVWLDGVLASSASWEDDGSTTTDPEGFPGVDSGGWRKGKNDFAGDFAKLIENFMDIDMDDENLTPQVGFLDDGTPPSNDPLGQSTGGNTGSFSYGVPGDWTTNYTDGISRYHTGVWNEVWSPEIPWDDTTTTADDDYVDAVLELDAWLHLPLTNGIFWTFNVRYLDAATQVWSGWFNPYFFYQDVASYTNRKFSIDQWVPVDAEKIQISLGVRDWSAVQFPQANDGTPAPLFDNVKVYKVFGTVEVLPTPLGTDVTVADGPVSVTYPLVGVAGETTITIQGHNDWGGLFAFQIAGAPPLFADIETTALVNFPAEVCLNYDEANLLVDEADLVLLHWNSTTGWEDITSSLDTVNDVICGLADSLSPFVIGTPYTPVAAPPQPGVPRMLANVPNPFNPRTEIRFELGAPATASLDVFDARGRRVAQLKETQPFGTGVHTVAWDGDDDARRPIASGVYFAVLRFADGSVLYGQPMTLVR